MPPKDTDSAVAQTTKDTTFLATCFKHLKQPPQVDVVAVAAELKMSTGGTRNKLRPILKAMEEAGAAWLNDQASASAPERAGGAKSKPKTAGAEAKDSVVSDKDDEAKPATPKPKAKAQATPSIKAAVSAKKRGRKAKDTDADGGGSTTEDATPRKKAKVMKETGSADDAGEELEDGSEGAEVDGIEKEIKPETEDE